jgi:hypothetical protein
MALAPGTLSVSVEGTACHLLLDAGSIQSLELVRPLGSASTVALLCGSDAKSRTKLPRSLFEAMSHTCTLAGSRSALCSLLFLTNSIL